LISRRTIIWFVLLLLFSSALAVRAYQYGRPCREWTAAHPGQDSHSIEQSKSPVGGDEVSFSPCGMWQNMPIWDELCAIAWLISLVGSVRSLAIDIYRWIIAKKSGNKPRMSY
jgi:hypothetical protein